MSDLYTTREVLQLLKVDRITVYRMLQDGRLDGVKIGHQWRFKKEAVDQLLQSQKIEVGEPDSGLDTGLPVHCFQTIQNLVSELTSLDTIFTDLNGRTITEPNIQSQFNREIINKPGGLESCKFHWRSFAQQTRPGNSHFVSPTGIHYSTTTIHAQDLPVAIFLCGGYIEERKPLEELRDKHSDISLTWNIPLPVVQSHYQNLPEYDNARRLQLDRWVASTMQAIESVLSERSHFIGRMNQIANLTRI